MERTVRRTYVFTLGRLRSSVALRRHPSVAFSWSVLADGQILTDERGTDVAVRAGQLSAKKTNVEQCG
jgi:hypothetical protein